MVGLNRGRYTVQLDGKWRLYTRPLVGWEMLGIIQRNHDVGALARSPAGVLVQVNAGAVRSLDQRKAAAALDAANRGACNPDTRGVT